MSPPSAQFRLGVVGVVMASLFAVMFIRLGYLQILDSDRAARVSEANRVRVVAEEAPRGRILDVRGRVIVDNRTSRVVTIERSGLDGLDATERDELLGRLAAELTAFGVPTKVSRIASRIDDPQYDPIQPIPVAIDVPEAFEVFLAERAGDYPGVVVRRQSVRSYPYGETAAHLLGYVGRISAEEFEVAADARAQASSASDTASGGVPVERAAPAKPYQPDSQVGRGGVEGAWEDVLRGVPGQRTVEVDSLGDPVRTVDVVPAVPGDDIQLSIDIDLQQEAEVELANQLGALRGTGVRGGGVTRAPAGAVVMVDPRDGSLRAMASYPTFSPSDFVNGISAERYEALTGGEAVDNPLINRAISGQYAPGSTFKPITAWSALLGGIIGPDTTYADGGVYVIANCTGPGCERENDGGAALGTVGIPRSLTQSSNVFYYWIGDNFYAARNEQGDLFQNALAQLGFGTPTGLDLLGEAAGVIPGPVWKRATYEALPPDQQEFGDPTWYPGDEASMATGQGDFLATPLQMAMAYAVLANGGRLDSPRLVERILPWDAATTGDPGTEVAPVVVRSVPMQDVWLERIHEGMVGVTSSGDGTAASAFGGWDHAAWPVAAKTGTAEVQGRADSSVFGAFGPVGDPEIVAFAVLEESGYGGEAAAPMVRRILDWYVGSAR